MTTMNAAIGLAMCGVLSLGCSRKSQTEPVGAGLLGSSASAAQIASAPSGYAKLGAMAPDFELPDLDGKLVKLSSFRGKTVVLEWFNPGCPFVKASHTKGSLVDTAARHE